MRRAAIAALLIAAGTGMAGCMDNDNAINAMYAVEQSDPAAVREAVAARRGLEQRDESGNTPLFKAAASGQYVIAEILVDGGADIWANDEFGLTVAHLAAANPFPPGTAEGDAKARVLAKLRARGFPVPPPPQAEVLRLVAAGGWPPHRATH